MFKQRIFNIARKLLPTHSPDFLIIGAQKSGTTSLHYYLNQHPNLTGSYPKELHYFNRDIHFNKSFGEYKKHFRGIKKKDTLLFEATPAYIYHPGSAELIKKHLPNTKLIVILRNPVQRAYSAWNHYSQFFEAEPGVRKVFDETPRTEGNYLHELYFKNREVFPTFRECIEIELDLIEKGKGYEPALLRRGVYIDQLKNYWNYFSKDQVMIIGFRDLTEKKKETLQKIEKFLNIPQYDWDNLIDEPKNVREYKEKINEEDRVLLEKFYSEYNLQLEKEVGKLNW